MNIIKILNSWGVNTSYGDSLFDCIDHLNADKVFYIDKLPMKVPKKNYQKFDQINIFYQEVIERKSSKKEFIRNEKKFINVMNKFWLYNDLFVQSESSKEYPFSNLDIIVDKRYKKYIALSKQKFLMHEVTDRYELEFWTQLGTRDAMPICFYLKDFESIIIVSWSTFVIFINNLEYKVVIEKIINSEGLFLRNYKSYY